MILIFLIILGLVLGSFVNAAVWRIHEQSRVSKSKNRNKKYLSQLSIVHGRSMCSACHHRLAAKDLIPVFSWLILRGKCRYCGKPIPDNPIAEIGTMLFFVFSYIWWPFQFHGIQVVIFVLWLMFGVGFMILTVYDIRWMLLPNKVVYPLLGLAIIQALLLVASASQPLHVFLDTLLAMLIGGGIFYLLFQISAGQWIGGGDVKLGWLLGILMASPTRSLLYIFVAALGGTIAAIPMLLSKKLNRKSTVPFGPFLMLGAVVVQLFGASILSWYEHLLFRSV
jgi:prepilin signal peptidase PulO-like enzyme (type II secretory pathway)